MKGTEESNKLKCRAKRVRQDEGSCKVVDRRWGGDKIQGVIGSWERRKRSETGLMWLMKALGRAADKTAASNCVNNFGECCRATRDGDTLLAEPRVIGWASWDFYGVD